MLDLLAERAPAFGRQLAVEFAESRERVEPIPERIANPRREFGRNLGERLHVALRAGTVAAVEKLRARRSRHGWFSSLHLACQAARSLHG